jgi:hypothetical protein
VRYSILSAFFAAGGAELTTPTGHHTLCCMSEPITLTGLLASYGAILSSIGLGWNLYRDLRDRARVKVKMHIRRLVRGPDGKVYQVTPDMPVEGATAQLFLVADVTNVGRRPVKWMGWGGKWHTPRNGKDTFVIVPTHLPIMLAEGDSSSEMTTELEGASGDVKRLFVYDSTGKNWYLSRRALKQLKKECRKFQSSPTPT